MSIAYVFPLFSLSSFFKVTHDITKYTKAALFSHIGKKTKVAFRGSTVGGESGSADTARDPRGFALKFYTEGTIEGCSYNQQLFLICFFSFSPLFEEGNWDLVGNNTPIFFIRDPIFVRAFFL